MYRLQNEAKWVPIHKQIFSLPPTTIKIQSLNVVSLPTHIENLIADNNLMASDVLCLQETHMLNPTRFNLKAMNLTCTCGDHGLAIYTHTRVKLLNTHR